jgi:hypothetical protein
MAKKKCTWCNKEITSEHVSIVLRDSANKEHLFHEPCEKELWKWFKEHLDDHL